MSEHFGEAVIAARFGVPTHRVVQRRRARRAPGGGAATAPAPDPPPAADLRRLYSDVHQTLAQIARRYHTASPKPASGCAPPGCRSRRGPVAPTEVNARGYGGNNSSTSAFRQVASVGTVGKLHVLSDAIHRTVTVESTPICLGLARQLETQR